MRAKLAVEVLSHFTPLTLAFMLGHGAADMHLIIQLLNLVFIARLHVGGSGSEKSWAEAFHCLTAFREVEKQWHLSLGG